MKPNNPLQRTDLMDTSLSAHKKVIEMLRQMTPEEKLMRTFEMIESIRKLKTIANSHDRSENSKEL
jgi:hypothetical protein